MKQSLILLVITLGGFLLHAQPVNQNISGGIVFEGEPFLAMDPSDANHMVVAWIGHVLGQQGSTIKTRRTTDGGQTWSNIIQLPHWRSTYKSADPSICFDGQGKVFIAYVDYRQSPDSGGVFVVSSNDGGLSWGGMALAIDAYADGMKLPIDRPWLVVDRSGGQFDGSLYLTTKPPSWVGNPNRPYTLHSSDSGQSWSSWSYLDGTGYLVGPYIAQPMATPSVSSNGTMHAVYPTYELSQNLLPGYVLASSYNGGQSFSYSPIWFSTVMPADSMIKGGYLLLADPSDAAHLAFVTPVNQLGDQDIYLLESHDSGQSWAAPLRINDDPSGIGVTQDLVWGAFDNDGDLVLTWRDRRNATGTGYMVDSEIWGAVRWHDSTDFEPNFRLSDTLAEWNNILTQNGNDFMCAQVRNDTLSAVWGDTRNGRLNIYFLRWGLRSQGPLAIHLLGSEDLGELKVFPNPFADWVEVQGGEVQGLELFDLQGRRLKKVEGNRMNVSDLSSGPYLLEIKLPVGEAQVQVIKK